MVQILFTLIFIALFKFDSKVFFVDWIVILTIVIQRRNSLHCQKIRLINQYSITQLGVL